MGDVLVVVLRRAGIDVHHARRNLAGLWVLKVLQIERRHIAVGVDIDHAAGLALAEELVDSHCELGAVGKVVCHRILAADIIADLHRTGLHTQLDVLQLFLKQVVEQHSLGDLAELRVAVIVVGEMDACIGSFLGNACIVEKSLGGHYSTVVDAHDFPLDNG